MGKAAKIKKNNTERKNIILEKNKKFKEQVESLDDNGYYSFGDILGFQPGRIWKKIFSIN